MEFIKPGTYIDFMRHRAPVLAVSGLLVVASIVSIFVPGPNFGIDFRGGTEIQVAFEGDVTSGQLRKLLEGFGYERPDVVAVEGEPHEFMIRIQEVSSVSEKQKERIRSAITGALEVGLDDMEISPGGDKLTLELDGAVEPSTIQEALEGADIRVQAVNQFGRDKEHRYEAHLVGVADKLMRQLRGELGADVVPDAPRRVEWVGPKAGEQLRNAAIKALLYAIAFIMVYVAFRFDLRFAPGGVLAMMHDAIITLGIYVALQKEVNLTTVAALLTIIGYSINDTIVVYDRIRENMGRLRDKPLRELINISTSQMLSRTIVTSGTTLVSVSAFFFWGTPVIKDIAFALFIGILIGTYSSIYVAAPATEWMDTRFFSKRKG